jgi:hypothetical protein
VTKLCGNKALNVPSFCHAAVAAGQCILLPVPYLLLRLPMPVAGPAAADPARPSAPRRALHNNHLTGGLDAWTDMQVTHL